MKKEVIQMITTIIVLSLIVGGYIVLNLMYVNGSLPTKEQFLGYFRGKRG